MMQRIMLAVMLALALFNWVGDNRPAEKSVIEYTVKSGETLWEIADKHYHMTNTGMSFAEYEFNVRKDNKNLQSDKRVLQPGDKVRVPVWKVKG